MEKLYDQLDRLRVIRTQLDKGLNPDRWEWLAGQYEQIGAVANAARCREKAAYCRQVMEGKAELEAV